MFFGLMDVVKGQPQRSARLARPRVRGLSLRPVDMVSACVEAGFSTKSLNKGVYLTLC